MPNEDEPKAPLTPPNDETPVDPPLPAPALPDPPLPAPALPYAPCSVLAEEIVLQFRAERSTRPGKGDEPKAPLTPPNAETPVDPPLPAPALEDEPKAPLTPPNDEGPVDPPLPAPALPDAPSSDLREETGLNLKADRSTRPGKGTGH